MTRIYRRRRRTNYLLPFLVLVSLGVVLILAFQLFGMLFSSTKGDAIYYVAEGRSKLLPFGLTEWENTYNGAKFKLGDSVKTLNNGKGVISFYDGTVVRLDENTEVTLIDITKNGDDQQILLNLVRGHVWVNKPKQKVIRKTDFMINTDYANYSITGTIFAIAKETEQETLRVLKGEVEVDILENVDGVPRSVDTISVGIGQQVDLDSAVMQAYFDREQPSVKRAIDASFSESEWYKWNDLEDASPTDFSANPSGSQYEIDEDVESTEEVEEDIQEDLSSLEKPEIIFPENLSIVSEEASFEVEGRASSGTKQVIVEYKLEGSSDYQSTLLEDFDTDTGRFSYQISPSDLNIESGKNVYRFRGIDESNLKTEATELNIEYIGDEEDVDNNNVTGAALTTPTVSTVGGENYSSGMTVDSSSVIITGSVAGADSVYVNDYKLSRFSEGDTTWSYNASTAIGNLVEGENTYEVYATSEDGKKSSVLTIVLDYDAPQSNASSSSSSTNTSASSSSNINQDEAEAQEDTSTTDDAAEDSETSETDSEADSDADTEIQPEPETDVVEIEVPQGF